MLQPKRKPHWVSQFLTKPWAWSTAVPVTPSVAFTTIRKTADWPWLREESRNSSYLQAFSLAGPPDARVVLPPSYVDQARTEPRSLFEYRDKLNVQREELQSLRGEALRVFTSRGIPVAMRRDHTYYLDDGPAAPSPAPDAPPTSSP